RAFLPGEPLLDADELALRLGAAEAAAQAAVAAERASRHHWTLVFLSGKADSEWDAVALEKKGARWVFVIPALAFETQVSVRGNIQPNDGLRLVLKSVNIPKGEAFFAAIE
ncbi:MAG: ribonuclease II, partial [Spirochaetes bacterium]|nr:ribonuclease II [Spirochaetota bacterium]